ncbi:MAG: protease inhibitor I42 family protein [Methanolobus sp.]
MEHEFTEGVKLINDSFNEAANSEEIVGAGGVHQWTFELAEIGRQNISAVYMRPWEDKTGDEDTFVLDIDVIAENELIKNSGTVTFLELEGGFYGILTEDENRYDPINLADEFKKDGMQVELPHILEMI